MSSYYITGLDIGTASTKVVVAQLERGRLIPKWFSKEPSAGVRKGAIVDLSEATPVVGRIISEVKKISKSAARNVYVAVGTPQAGLRQSKGIVAVSRADSEIYQDDVDRAIKASQAVNLGANRMIVHNVVCEFVVDGVGDIADPLGLTGSRLEVSSLIIDAFTPHVKSAIKTVELAGGQVGGVVFGPLAAARAVLSKNQKELGVVLVDIGAGTTGMCVWEEGKLVTAAQFPIGASHISNDIAIGLKIPVAQAEVLKLRFGEAVARDVNAKESIDMKEVAAEEAGTVSRRYLAEIIESRLAEMFELVNNEIKAAGRSGRCAGGVVIVGGGAKLPGLTSLARHELKLSSQIGSSLMEGWHTDTGIAEKLFQDPEFVNALGLSLLGVDHEGAGSMFQMPRVRGVRELLRYFTP